MTRGDAVWLLLFTLFQQQPQSKGNLLADNSSPTDHTTALILEDINEEIEEPETHEDYYDGIMARNSELYKRSINDQPSRRSSTDRNFQRFGRSGFFPTKDKSNKDEKHVVRFSRGTKDSNFIRFGKQDKNFMRFGKNDKNFMRFGKNDKNFMRFGKPDKSFMRFGRDPFEYPFEDNDDYERLERLDKSFLRFGKGAHDSNFMRFGKSPSKSNFMRFGKASSDSAKNFIRFGKRVERNVDSSLEDYDNLFRSERDQRNPNTKSVPHIRYGRDVIQQIRAKGI